ncbi:MAG: kelch repeat-containing protein [Thermodesulfobacteriota bacterium]|nr:kelch repeat-containing protein [Thermodesulfobacteriota bacterium]
MRSIRLGLMVGIALVFALSFTQNLGAEISIEWTRVSDLNGVNMLLDAAVLDGKIYAVGGHRPYGGYLNTLQVYDPSVNPPNGQWTNLATMHVGRSYPAATTLNGEIWAINGTCCGGSVPHDSIEIYNPTENTWYWSTDKGIPYMGVRSESKDGAVTLDGKVYVAGGNGGRSYGGMLDLFMMWDGSNWVGQPDLPALPMRLGYSSATVANGEIYVTGGRCIDDYAVNKTYIYNPDSNTWREGPSLNAARLQHTSVTVEDRIFVFGGYDYTIGGLDSVEMLDLSEEDPAWEILVGSELSAPRWGLAAAVLNGEIYLIGGQYPHANALSIVEKGTIIEPNAPPVADAGPDQAVYCVDPSGTEVTLDASGSLDPDAGDAIESWAWYKDVNDNGLPEPEEEIASGEVVSVSLGLGTHSIILVVNDGESDSELANDASDTDSFVTIKISFNKHLNSIWVAHKYVLLDSVEVKDIEELRDTLFEHDIGTVYVHVGCLEADGTLEELTSLADGYGRFLATMRSDPEKQFEIIAMLNGRTDDEVPGCPPIRLTGLFDRRSRENVRNIAQVCEDLVTTNWGEQEEYFDGVQLDIEPISNFNLSFLRLLYTAKQSIGEKVLCVAGQSIKPFAGWRDRWHWGLLYYSLVSRSADRIQVMAYDSQQDTGEAYVDWMEDQVNVISRVVDESKINYVSVGIPAHKTNNIETMDNALAGIRNALVRDDTDRDVIDGVAIFMFGKEEPEDVDAGDWATYEDKWVGGN